MFSEFVQLAVTGIAVGSIYGLIALGFGLIYTSVNVVNFAQGDFAMIGAYFMVSLELGARLPLWLALILSVLLAGGLRRVVPAADLSAGAQPAAQLPAGDDRNGRRLGLHRTAFPHPLRAGAVSAAQYFPARNRSSSAAFRSIRNISSSSPSPRRWSALLNWFLETTKLGKQLQASAQDPDTARLMGIRVARMAGLTFAISTGALGPCRAADRAGLYGHLDHGGHDRAESLRGGHCRRVRQHERRDSRRTQPSASSRPSAATYISGTYRDAFPFIFLILFLIFKPLGLFGEKVSQKV